MKNDYAGIPQSYVNQGPYYMEASYPAKRVEMHIRSRA
jgi:hypothetical protein